MGRGSDLGHDGHDGGRAMLHLRLSVHIERLLRHVTRTFPFVLLLTYERPRMCTTLRFHDVYDPFVTADLKRPVFCHTGW